MFPLHLLDSGEPQEQHGLIARRTTKKKDYNLAQFGPEHHREMVRHKARKLLSLKFIIYPNGNNLQSGEEKKKQKQAMHNGFDILATEVKTIHNTNKSIPFLH